MALKPTAMVNISRLAVCPSHTLEPTDVLLPASQVAGLWQLRAFLNGSYPVSILINVG